MKIKIISAPASPKCWYKDKIGQTLEVTLDGKASHGSAPYQVPGVAEVWCVEEVVAISAVRYIRREDGMEVEGEDPAN